MADTPLVTNEPERHSGLLGHPDATVLRLGCSTESRAFCVNPPAIVRWFDVDYPDVIKLRRQLFPEPRMAWPQRGNRAAYHLIGAPRPHTRHGPRRR